jgi:pSer/pThr/pTyr-binding forkhead associated (FHA) protein
MTLRIVHTYGHRTGAERTFTSNVVRIGRAPDNDIVLDANHDREASGHHAELRREGNTWIVVDLGSRNGTFVGAERVERRPLVSGDEIALGAKGPRLRIELGFGAKGAEGDPKPQMFNIEMEARAPLPMQPVASAAVPMAPAAGARVGQRTLAAMVSAAVNAASARVRPGRTMEINAIVERKVSEATASQRRTAYVLGAVLIAALGALGGLIYWSTRSQDDIQHLREELAQLPPEDPRRKDIEARLGTLHPANASLGRNLYDRSRKGIFMLAIGSEGICTAFAVRPSILATNARCIHEARARNGAIKAIENEGRGEVKFDVIDMRPHPSYRQGDPNSITPDVGVVTIRGRAAMVLEIATQKELSAMGAGDDVYVIGFPDRLMDVSNPAATFLAAHIGRVTGAAGRPVPYKDNWLVQHDASSTRGTTGSPIFNGQGKVVAINAGEYLEEGEQKIAGRNIEVVKASPYKFGMRIDLIEPLLR